MLFHAAEFILLVLGETSGRIQIVHYAATEFLFKMAYFLI